MPIDAMIKMRILNYWYKLVTNVNKFKFNVVLYRIMYKMALDGSFIYPWLDYVRRSLDDLGLSYYWLYQERLDIAGLKRFKRTIKIRIFEGVFSSRICTNYRLFKLECKMEPFLSVLPKNLALKMLKFRCSNTRLPVVLENHDTGLLDNVYCTRCDKISICDELHVVLEWERRPRPPGRPACPRPQPGPRP